MTDREDIKAEYAVGLLQDALEQLRALERFEEGETAARLVRLALETLTGSASG